NSPSTFFVHTRCLTPILLPPCEPPNPPSPNSPAAPAARAASSSSTTTATPASPTTPPAWPTPTSPRTPPSSPPFRRCRTKATLQQDGFAGGKLLPNYDLLQSRS